jgi:GT2 family glycosyltransferase/SAM-dependent methyltransferase
MSSAPASGPSAPTFEEGPAPPGPRVSVLIRSMNRPGLLHALNAVGAQTVTDIEIVLVNASGRPHPAVPAQLGGAPLHLVDPGRRLPRAAAANAALTAARAPWLMFLDDDDLIDPDHVERLLNAVQAEGFDPDTTWGAYAGVRLQSSDGQPHGVLDESFDRRRLWLANFLPIHAVLFSRRVLEAGCHFDEDFEVYEDWDFWQQVCQHHDLLHVPGVSATYRLVGDSGLSAQRDEALSRLHRERFYRKWLPQLDAEQAEQVLAFAEHTRGKLQALQAELGPAGAPLAALRLWRLESEQARAEAAQTRLQRDQAVQSLQQANEDHRQRWAAAVQAHQHERDRLKEQVDAALTVARDSAQTLQQRSSDLQSALATYAELERGYLTVTSSLSWRVTAPLRALRGGLRLQGLPRRLLRALPVSAQGRQRTKVWLSGSESGRRVLRRLAPHAVPTATPLPPAADVDKQAVRAQAETELTAFLGSASRIDLRCHTDEPAISVIVVMFNQAGLTRLCLQALAESREVSFETLLVDNGSSDRVPALLDRVDGATVLRPGENLGFLRAVNLAAGQARGRHLLLLNNDAMVEPLTLAHAARRLDRMADVDAVGGPILLWDGRLQEAGSIIWRDGSCLGYGRGDDPARPEYRFVRDVDYCSGAFLMLRRQRFNELGGFDDAYAPAYYEETDLCARLWEQGRRIVYDPAVRVRHFEFASETSSGQAIALQQRNRARFQSRHAAFLAAQAAPDAAAIVRARQRLPPGAKRVLVIDDRVPLPWLGQGYPRAASLLAALADDGHAVTHYPLQFPHEDAADVARAVPETVEVMLGHGLTGLAPFLSGRPDDFDVVIVSRPHNMAQLRSVRQRHPQVLAKARVVYDAEAMFSLRDISKAALEGKPFSGTEQQRRVGAELALAEGAHAVLAVSQQEAAHYRGAGFGDVQVLGHQLEVVKSNVRFEARAGFLFVGALTADDTPNSDSVLWFVREVWPHISARLGPLAHLNLVGPCEAPSVLALRSPTVRIHGKVDTLAPHVDLARVFVVPTRFAAGIPHKAHEAAARGLPMVVTPLIAQQLGWQDIVGVGIDAAAFAEQCLALYEDEARWRGMHQALLDAVARDCAPAVFRAALRRVLGTEAAVATPADIEREAAEPLPAPAAQAGPATRPVGGTAALAQLDNNASARADERTAALWGRDAEARGQAEHALRRWASHPVTAAEINRQVSGDAHLGWVAWLQRQHFPHTRRRGLSLGSGSGAVVVDALHLGIVDHMEGVDISPAAVAVAQARAAAADLNGRALFRAANINELPLQGPYDLILFEQSLHHIDALDRVLDRCRDALAPDGLFVINEYVGPDRFQWSDEVERLMNALLERLPERLRRDPTTGAIKRAMRRADPAEVIAVDPSEAIHSSAILAACADRFEVVDRRDFGGTLLQFMLADIAANFDPSDDRDVALMRLMVLLEAELVRSGTITSDFSLCVYRHRPS